MGLYLIFQAPKKEVENLKPSITSAGNLAQSCEADEGNWISEFNECEDTGKNWCDEHGGDFFECDSSCRHASDPLASCTLQCVEVCKLNKD